KNDSIGFFGPIGWATLTDDERTIEARPGPELIDHCDVLFEGWAIDELETHVDKDPALRPWMSPRLRPELWCGPDGVYVPGGKKVTLDPLHWEVVQLCDGVRTAIEIARLLLHAKPPVVGQEQEVFDALARLASRDLLVWRFEVAPQQRPEREFAWR